MRKDFDFKEEVVNYSTEELKDIAEVIEKEIITRKNKEYKKLVNEVLDSVEKIVSTSNGYKEVFLDTDDRVWDWEDIYHAIKEYSEKLKYN